MKNLKIRMKLLLSFGLCFIMTLILGLTAIIASRSINQIADNYVEISIPATTYVWTIRRGVQSTQRYAIEATIVMSQSELTAVENSLDEEVQKIENALSSLGKLNSTFQAQINVVQGYLDEAADIREDIIRECEKLTTEGNDNAYNIFKDEYEPCNEQIVDAVLELYDEVNDAIDQRHVNAQRTFVVALVVVIAVLAACLLVIGTLVKILSMLITTPVKEIEEAMDAVAEGRLKDARVDYQAKDELGNLAGTVRTTVGMLQKMVPDIAHLSQEMGNGNFAVTSADSTIYVGEYAGIIDGLRYIRDTLTGTIEQIDVAADQMLSGAEQVASGAQALSQGATEQASSVQELAAAVTDINDKIKLASENSEAANRFTQEGEVGVKQSSEYMASLMNAMNDIQTTSNEISKIIKNIDDIAFQTNILALNAAVEAARAGAAGKGFAVVADEVRNLASKSAEAAKSTTTLIDNSMNAVEVGMRHAKATSDAIKNVAEKSAVTAEKMQEITNAAAEQSTAITQISAGIDQIASVTQTTSATSEESAAASEELSSQANFLKELTGNFTLYTGDHSASTASARAASRPAPAVEREQPEQEDAAAPTSTFSSTFNTGSKY